MRRMDTRSLLHKVYVAMQNQRSWVHRGWVLRVGVMVSVPVLEVVMTHPMVAFKLKTNFTTLILIAAHAPFLLPACVTEWKVNASNENFEKR